MKKIIKIFAVVIVVGYIAIIGSNMIGGSFKSLPKEDQNILMQFSKFSASKEVWKNYNLKDKGLLFIRDSFGGPAYLINPEKKPSSVFAKEIDVPGGIKAYRVSGFYPSILKLKISPGYFNGTEDYLIFKRYPKVLGTPIYYLKYSQKKNIDVKNSPSYFMPYLAHEAFHFFIQENWMGGGRFSGNLSSEDIKLLQDEYNVLSKVQSAMIENKEADWKKLASEYVAIVDKRIKQNPSYLKSELSMETVEGTATYVGIKAAKDVGYDFGIMYFSNIKNVPFRDVINTYRNGKLSNEFLSDKMPYDTGAQLCFLLDKLNKIDWQGELNKQTLDKPVYLYDLVKKSIK